MEKRWPVLAQILIALGCGGGMISIWAGFTQKSWLMVALGVGVAFVFWFFYQLKPWAKKAVNLLLVAVIVSDIISILFAGAPVTTALILIAFRILIFCYFNTKIINRLFEEE